MVRSVIAINGSRATGPFADHYTLSHTKLADLNSDRDDLRVLARANSGSASHSAVLDSFWISVASHRIQHAVSWHVQLLTFPVEEAILFHELLFGAVEKPGAIDLGWCVNLRGLEASQVVILPKFEHFFRL